jgi:hypothetical protein
MLAVNRLPADLADIREESPEAPLRPRLVANQYLPRQKLLG